jgi:hypothetical protein
MAHSGTSTSTTANNGSRPKAEVNESPLTNNNLRFYSITTQANYTVYHIEKTAITVHCKLHHIRMNRATNGEKE